MGEDTFRIILRCFPDLGLQAESRPGCKDALAVQEPVRRALFHYLSKYMTAISSEMCFTTDKS